MSFPSFLKSLRQRHEIPADVPVPRPRIQLGPISAESNAMLATSAPSPEPALRLTDQQLRDLAKDE